MASAVKMVKYMNKTYSVMLYSKLWSNPKLYQFTGRATFSMY